MLVSTFIHNLAEDNPFIYFIFRIDCFRAVAWFTSEDSCLAAFKYFYSDSYDWLAVRYSFLFCVYSHFEHDSLRELYDSSRSEGGSHVIE